MNGPKCSAFCSKHCLFWKGNWGECVGLTPTLKKTLQKSEDESCLFRQFLVFGPSVFGGIFTINMGSHEFPGPFPSRFVDQQNSPHADLQSLGAHENRDPRGESLKRWETWFLFGPGYCT